jgi:hypothetical protein
MRAYFERAGSSWELLRRADDEEEVDRLPRAASTARWAIGRRVADVLLTAARLPDAAESGVVRTETIALVSSTGEGRLGSG